MSILTLSPVVVNPDRNRYGRRAPKGGCTVAGKAYKGGQFCPEFDVDNPHELPTVEIRGSKYIAETIPAGEFGVAAVRLTKLAGRECYDLIRTDANVLECSCPDWVVRHEGRGSCCKHLAFAVANGLLPAAPAEPEDDAPVPSWDAPRFEATDEETAELYADPEDDPAYHAFLDSMALDREPADWHEAERVAAVGCLMARV